MRGETSAKSGAPRIHSLDSIRGIAALVVVFHHCILVLPAFCDFFFQWLFYGHRVRTSHGVLEYLLLQTPLKILWAGYEAVTLFYVLSGFVLALPWASGRPQDYPTYAIRRFCRLYLPYITIVCIAAGLSTLLHINAPIPGTSYWVWHWNWSQPVTSWVLIDHAFMLGQTNNLDGVVHSLIWEMRISAIFPAMMMVLCRWRTLGAVGLMILIAAVMGLCAVAAHLFPGRGAIIADMISGTAFYSHHFVVGAFIALNLERLKALLSRVPQALIIGLLLVGLFILQGHWSGKPDVQTIIVGLGAAAIIIATLTSPLIEHGLSHPFLRWLGEISYSLYLVHVPLLFTALILLHRFVPVWVILVCVPPTALVTGWLFHRFIAIPSVEIGRRLSKTAPVRWLGAQRAAA